MILEKIKTDTTMSSSNFEESKQLNENLNENVKFCFENSTDELDEKIIKLSEETGEVSSIYLALKGTENKSKSALKELNEKGILGVIEELLDVIMVADDTIHTLKKIHDISDDEVLEILNKKFLKWKNKLGEK